MEIEFLLFPIQQLSKKLISHLVNKVLLSGMLICIKSLIKLALEKNGKTCYFSTEKTPKLRNICIVQDFWQNLQNPVEV